MSEQYTPDVCNVCFHTLTDKEQQVGVCLNCAELSGDPAKVAAVEEALANG